MNVERNEKYAFKYEKVKYLALVVSYSANYPLTFVKLYKNHKLRILLQIYQNVKMRTKAKDTEILTFTQIYLATRFSDLHPICSVLVTHVTIFEYFVQRTKDIVYRK